MLTKKDLEQIGDVVDLKLDQKLLPIKEDISQIRKDIKLITGFFDREYLQLRKRIERIEKHLNLSSAF